jgi:hypothetical protein
LFDNFYSDSKGSSQQNQQQDKKKEEDELKLTTSESQIMENIISEMCLRQKSLILLFIVLENQEFMQSIKHGCRFTILKNFMSDVVCQIIHNSSFIDKHKSQQPDPTTSSSLQLSCLSSSYKDLAA